LTNEEMNRAIEFIIQQQAKYAARLEKDESRLAGLEEYFKMLVELARGADERQDTMGQAIIQQQAQNTVRLEKDEARLARLEESFTTLVELARRADERLDARGQ
jgi:hypothetical protein